MESSRRYLLNDMAEHRPILKNNQNMHYSLSFRDRPMLSHINGKLSPRPFEWCGWTQVYLESSPKYVQLRFSFTPKTGTELPEMDVFCLLWSAFVWYSGKYPKDALFLLDFYSLGNTQSRYNFYQCWMGDNTTIAFLLSLMVVDSWCER